MLSWPDWQSVVVQHLANFFQLVLTAWIVVDAEKLKNSKLQTNFNQSGSPLRLKKLWSKNLKARLKLIIRFISSDISWVWRCKKAVQNENTSNLIAREGSVEPERCCLHCWAMISHTKFKFWSFDEDFPNWKFQWSREQRNRAVLLVALIGILDFD